MARPLGARDIARPRRNARTNPIPLVPWIDMREPRPLERALAMGCAVLAVFDDLQRFAGWVLVRNPLA